MSTRGLFGFRKDGKDKLTYNHFDSYQDYLGRVMAKFCAEHKVSELKAVCDSIELVDEESTPTIEQITKCVKAGYYDLNVSTQSVGDWYCILREMQGNPEEYAKNFKNGHGTYMIDSHEFIQNSLFCEYAYIINLDTEKLEFWIGFQHRAQAGNRYGETTNGRGYYPCRLLLEIPLEPKIDPDKAVETMNKAEEEAVRNERSARWDI